MAVKATAIAYSAAARAGWRRYLPALSLLAPLLVFLAIFYAVPLGHMVGESLKPSPSDSVQTGLTAKQYERVADNGRSYRGLERTLRLSLIATAITFLLAYPLALLLLQTRPRLRTFILIAIFVSLASSLIVRNYGWLVMLADAGPVNKLLLGLGLVDRPQRIVYSEAATIVALVHYCLPFMILPIYGALLRIPASYGEAAQSLGAAPFRALGNIVLPLSIAGIFGGTTLSFAICMSAFVTPLMLGSPATAMISQIAAEQFLIQLNFPYGSAMIVVLTLITFTIVFLYGLAIRKLFRTDV
ncbi:MAG: ABC transporter permease [Alphaproteobacteria bacterium]